MDNIFYHLASRDQASHVIFSSLTGRKFLVPLALSSFSESLGFFGVGGVRLFISRLLFSVRSKTYARLRATGMRWFDDELAQRVIFIGSPGPYQKFTVRAKYGAENEDVVVKFANTPAAAKLLGNEAETLALLQRMDSIAKNTPRLVAHGQEGGLSWVAQSPNVGRPANNSDDVDILNFLQRVGKIFLRKAPYSQSSARTQLVSRVDKLGPKFSPAWFTRSQLVLSFLDRNALKVMDFTRVHGDFTRWNIKVDSEGPFIFDWEYSGVDYPVGYDFLHFHLLPRVAKGKLSVKELKAVISLLAIWLNSKDQKLLTWTTVFYLFDLCACYLESNDGQDAGDVVVQGYANMLDYFVGKKEL